MLDGSSSGRSMIPNGNLKLQEEMKSSRNRENEGKFSKITFSLDALTPTFELFLVMM
jgi:hypothetical protein